MSFNGASTIFGVASWKIKGLRKGINPGSTYRLPLWAKMLLTILRPPPTIERPPSINNFCGGSVSYTAMHCITVLQNWVLRSQSFQYVLVSNLNNMHAMSHRSDCFACGCRVNIQEPAVCFTVPFPLAGVWVGLLRFLIPTTMSDSKSSNTSLLEFMISSKNECGFIRDLSDLTLQIVFDAWWASMNVGSKWPIGWNTSRHSLSWRDCSHCTIEETGSPGIICIVCHQVLCHPSDHGTSSMGKHLRAEAQIAKLNELTESEVTELTSSTVNETALAILTTQEHWGRSYFTSRLIHIDWNDRQNVLNWQLRTLKPPKFTKTRGIANLMLGFVSAHIQRNAIYNLELQRTYKALCDDLVLPSATTLSNIC